MTLARPARARLALLLGLVAVFLGGCVYLRLLELKKQLEHFDQHFDLRTDDGIRLLCRTPVLYTDDVRWLGLKPESIKKLGSAEQWQIRWVKELPPGVKDTGSFYIALELMFAGDKLTGVAIPESYFELMPKSFVLGVIKSVGGAKINRAARMAEAAVASETINLARPKMPSIDKILGVPTEERVEGPHTIQRYRYVPVTKEPKPGVFEMTLRFDTKSGEMLHWLGKTPMGVIAFDFSSGAKAPPKR